MKFKYESEEHWKKASDYDSFIDEINDLRISTRMASKTITLLRAQLKAANDILISRNGHDKEYNKTAYGTNPKTTIDKYLEKWSVR